MEKDTLSIQHLDVKKKLMFAIETDANYITYNIILILYVFKCYKNRYFKDYNKLAVLITAVQKLPYKNLVIEILSNDSFNYEANYSMLLEFYYSSRLIKRSINSVIFALEKRNILNLKRAGNTVDINLIDKSIADVFKEKIEFKDDIIFFSFIQEKINRFTARNENSVDDIIFKGLGEKEWEAYL